MPGLRTLDHDNFEAGATQSSAVLETRLVRKYRVACGVARQRRIGQTHLVEKYLQVANRFTY